MTKYQKIVIAGGTGFLGKVLIQHFANQTKEIVILSRKHHLDYGNVHFVKWDGRNLGSWSHCLEGADVLINLNGRSVDCRYNEKNKQLIYDTRIEATTVLGVAIEHCKQPPKLWINGASATIYRHSLREPMDEETGELGQGFSVDVCKKWEASFNQFELRQTRKVVLRIAIVLGKEDGAFIPLKHLTKLGFGGKMGSGYQMISWLHENDFAGIVEYCIDNQSVRGVYNASAPNPIRNQWFQKVLRNILKVRIGIPMPSWVLKIGAILIGTETELILKSRYVIPVRLQEGGYHFKFKRIEDALEDLCEIQTGSKLPKASFHWNELVSDPPKV